MRRLLSFFDFQSERPRPSFDTQLIGPRLVLRMGTPTDWQNWRIMRETSRDFLVPWEPTWALNGLSYSFFCALLRRHWRDWRQGKSYAFMILTSREEGKPEKIIGGITLSDVQRGTTQKGTLGYWIGKPYARQGYMTEAVGLVCDFAFQTLRLNRVEASCLPRNEPSKALLRRIGFEEEGYAKAYLQINGKWEDHLLWGKTAFRPQESG